MSDFYSLTTMRSRLLLSSIRAGAQSAPTSAEAEQMLRGLAAHAHLDLSGRVLPESQHPSGQGAYCDVYKGLSLVHAKCVAIKRFREYAHGGLSVKFGKVC